MGNKEILHVEIRLESKTYEALCDYAESFGYSMSKAVGEATEQHLQSAGWHDWNAD